MQGTSLDVVVIVGFVLLTVGILAAVWLAERGRTRALCNALRELGLRAAEHADAPQSLDYQFFQGCPILKDSRSQIPWAGRGVAGGRALHVFEYYYKTGSGKHTQHHRHLVVATPFGIPEFSLTVERKRWLVPHRPSIKPLPLVLEEATFNGRCNVYTAAPDLAPVLLGVDAQRFLAALDRRFWFRVNGGVLMVGQRCTPRAKHVRPTIALLDGLMAALPDELRAAAGISSGR